MEPAFSPLMIVLQGLAAGSDNLRRPPFPESPAIPHDLILAFERARRQADSAGGASWTPEQRRVLTSIYTALQVASGASNAAVWSGGAPGFGQVGGYARAIDVAGVPADSRQACDPFWIRVCELARIALDAFGWPLQAAARSA